MVALCQFAGHLGHDAAGTAGHQHHPVGVNRQTCWPLPVQRSQCRLEDQAARAPVAHLDLPVVLNPPQRHLPQQVVRHGRNRLLGIEVNNLALYIRPLQGHRLHQAGQAALAGEEVRGQCLPVGHRAIGGEDPTHGCRCDQPAPAVYARSLEVRARGPGQVEETLDFQAEAFSPGSKIHPFKVWPCRCSQGQQVNDGRRGSLPVANQLQKLRHRHWITQVGRIKALLHLAGLAIHPFGVLQDRPHQGHAPSASLELLRSGPGDAALVISDQEELILNRLRGTLAQRSFHWNQHRAGDLYLLLGFMRGCPLDRLLLDTCPYRLAG